MTRAHMAKIDLMHGAFATFMFITIARLVQVAIQPVKLVSFVGSQVAVRCHESGRYLEVASDGWIYASSFTHNKLSARFDVEPVSPDMVRSLVRARQYREQDKSVGTRRWDMRQRVVVEAWDE